jgi:2'-5' RNA ligase
VTRTFVAVFPPPALSEAICAAALSVRTPGDGIAWVRPANVHYTLRFLGDLAPALVTAACRAAEVAVVGVPPFALALGEAGAFPGVQRPRVLWLGAAEGGDALVALARRLDIALGREGFPPAERPFAPHLTLGRVHEAAAPWAGRAGDTLARLAAREFPRAPFAVDALLVIKSTLAAGGSRYETLAGCPLAGPAGSAGADGPDGPPRDSVPAPE